MASFGYNVKLGVDAREFEKGMRALGKSLQGIGNGLKKTGDDLKWISVTAAGALAGIVKSSVSFEDAWVGVTKTVEGTEEELAKVRQEIIDMSKATGISKNEIAGVAQAAGQLGIATKDLSKFTQVMVDLGVATNMTSEEAAISLAKFANITQMSSKDYDRLGSTITDLGNKFATTERDIVEMATRLASTGDLVGLSQAQIMALSTAMSALGAESEAGGTAMSKMFRKMQLSIESGDKNLQKFAKVAGMSVKDFKKAFETDALGALNLFVKGLAKIEDSGGSAVATLDNMKLSEVRLSDALLKLVGSGDLLDRAISTANTAWKENTALTKEAAKRYDEVKNRWGKIKETISEIAIKLGDVLLPAAKRVLAQAQKWLDNIAKKLDKFSYIEKKHILELLATIASIAPTLKIVGSAISNTGDIIRRLANPLNLATTAVVALVAGMYAYAKVQNDEIHGMKGMAAVLEDERFQWESLKEARNSALESSNAEIGVIEKLSAELKLIVDENGRVKEGYEDRAKFITTQLNEALGTELTLNGNIIENYKNMRSEIDKLIGAKKAEAALSAYQKEYEEALKNQAKATDNLIELDRQLSEQKKKLTTASGRERVEALQAISTISKSIREETTRTHEYGETIQKYQKLQEASISGTAEQIEEATNSLMASFSKSSEASKQSIDEQIRYQQESIGILNGYYSEAVRNHDDYQASILQTQIEVQEQELNSLYQSLVTQASMVKQLTPEQVSAFEDLANGDLIAYNKYVSQLSPEMQKELEKVTGVVTSNDSVEKATGSLSNDAARVFGVNISQMPKSQQETLGDVAGTINRDTSVTSASGNLGDRVETSFKENADGADAGANFNSGVESGIRNNQGGAIGAAVGFAASLLGAFKRRLDENSPSKETAEMGKFFVEGFTKGILGNQASAINAVSNLASKTLDAYQSGMMINDLQSGIGNIGTKVIYTTPNIVINTQELDSQKLEQIVHYVDRRFGAAM